MPTTLIAGYKFRFYSSDRFEPPHMHIISAEKIAKIWLQPISVEYNRGYNPAELNRIVKLTEDHIETLQESWNAYFAR
ncbi:MAG: DUF4160 domain-containing protein [Candidatus Latescibacteria bacterium]|nr:DUF4160 domain-containing protein [Candidatus Latescibacterota bacterium]MBT4139111.1 DUF4160 domain-containing protein [Candidatus Latescibacterota bacterium]MBT5831564.1 DUF4160 domain-containing protein [Candidatus Latescibacterota bacterium]